MEKIYLLFIEIISISIIFCGFCGQNPPKNSSYCGNYLELNSTHRCCFCTNNITNKNNCLLIINGNVPNNFTCECEKILEDDDLPGAPCRNHGYTRMHPEEISKEYCHHQSIDDRHPCCYYNDGNVKKCFGIGKITSNTLYTYNEFLDCLSKYNKLNYLLIVSILVLFI